MSVNDIFLFPSGLGWAGGGYGPATAFLKTTNFGIRWDSVSNIRLGRFSFLTDSLGWAVARNSRLSWKTTDGGSSWMQNPWNYWEIWPTDVVMISDTVALSTMWDNRADPPLDNYPVTMQDLTDSFPPVPTRCRLLSGIELAQSGHGFAVGLDEIVFTRDHGRSWIIQTETDRMALRGIDMVDSLTGWAVGMYEQVLKTTDGGAHWRSQTTARTESLFAIASVDERHAFAGGRAFMSTTDGGATWLRAPLPGSTFLFNDLCFIDSRKGWATRASYNVFHTTNGGNTWIEQTVGGISALYAIDFVDSNYGWCAGASESVYATTDGGSDLPPKIGTRS
jgi:photosystem II stability/assembly factor-like uncharacterized protein